MDWKNMSNNEILREQINIENAYETCKGQIIELLQKLDELNEEYKQSNNELKKRNYIV